MIADRHAVRLSDIQATIVPGNAAAAGPPTRKQPAHPWKPSPTAEKVRQLHEMMPHARLQLAALFDRLHTRLEPAEV